MCSRKAPLLTWANSSGLWNPTPPPSPHTSFLQFDFRFFTDSNSATTHLLWAGIAQEIAKAEQIGKEGKKSGLWKKCSKKRCNMMTHTYCTLPKKICQNLFNLLFFPCPRLNSMWRYGRRYRPRGKRKTSFWLLEIPPPLSFPLFWPANLFVSNPRRRCLSCKAQTWAHKILWRERWRGRISRGGGGIKILMW